MSHGEQNGLSSERQSGESPRSIQQRFMQFESCSGEMVIKNTQ
jgi:hypothetical protein